MYFYLVLGHIRVDGVRTLQHEVTLDEADAIETRVKELHGAERNVTVRELRQNSNRSTVARKRVPIVPDKFFFARVLGRNDDGGTPCLRSLAARGRSR
jgi:hypothetical protein